MDEELLACALKLLDKEEGIKDEDVPGRCSNCGGTDFVEENYERICEHCFAIAERYIVLRHENLSNYTAHSRNTYSRLSYFQQCIQRYQGNQITIIPNQVYDTLQDTEISREIFLAA